ncbi:SGNH/GDSL hydrolase family protein [Gordonia soli]|uniref:SGNH hydrolase-type esterase domain-containing protein n=1 Tax=Gordonia soli NBRC 108243 TaxID=1223545 RepID=M0QHC2_9ACTN|nr:SGNH/GDSL hydrolase family protein [Gordonia soli]GAC68035.1 hypothetical protein GS4_11_03070 [Gordonia soli NBRC 108243]
MKAIGTRRIVVVLASMAVLVALVGSVVALVGGGGEQAREAAPAPVQPRHLKYVALGSSYAAGPGSSPLADRRCLRTADNYPHQVAAARHFRLADASCSGATTANILSVPQLPAARAPQIDAVTPDTGLVTITIGGNDISYVGRVAAHSCRNQIAARSVAIHGCPPARARPEPTSGDYVAVQNSLVAVVEAVRARAPRATIVLVDYPPLIDPSGPRCGALGLSTAETAETVRIYDRLVAVTATAARESRALLVTVSKSGAAHTVCSSSPWLYGAQPPAPFHLNPRGKAGVARLVLDALRRSDGR